MKYSVKTVITILTFISIVSCVKKETIDDNQALTLEDKIENWLSENRSSSLVNLSSVSYDFENPIIKKIEGKDIVIFNNDKLSENKDVNYGLSFIETKTKIIPFLKVKNIIKSKNIKVAEYYDYRKNISFSITFDFVKKSISVKNLSNNSGIQARVNCGQATMDCVANAYGDQGWKSLSLTIATVFVPEATIVVAGVCALKNC